MPNLDRPLKVFLCHASADKPPVRELYRRLEHDGVDAWLDSEDLIPGQNWRVEIPNAVRDSDVVLICLSDNSVNGHYVPGQYRRQPATDILSARKVMADEGKQIE